MSKLWIRLSFSIPSRLGLTSVFSPFALASVFSRFALALIAVILPLIQGAAYPGTRAEFGRPAMLQVTRYQGQKSFDAGNVHLWMPNRAGKYELQDSTLIREISFQSCSMLAGQQKYSLGKMVETHYLTSEEASYFSGLGAQLDPAQVSFFETIHLATDQELQANYGDRYPEERVVHTMASEFMGARERLTPIKTAGLWSISAQVADKTSDGLPYRPALLPWQREPKRANVKLDRKKYKYVWEWGRAASDNPSDFSKLHAAIVATNYTELKGYGGDLEDAYVIFHSFNPRNTRYYNMLYPGTRMEDGLSSDSDALFLVPLKMALKKNPPESFSHLASEIYRRSHGKISGAQTLDLLLENRFSRWSELNFKSPSGKVSGVPFVINDISKNIVLLNGFRLQKLGLDDSEVSAVLSLLVNEISPHLEARRKGIYKDFVDGPLTSSTYHDHNAIEIANIDPQFVDETPLAARVSLFAAAAYYLHRAEQIHPEAGPMMRHYEIKFGVTTSNPKLAAQLRQLSPVKVVRGQGTFLGGMSAADREGLGGNFPSGPYEVFLFSLEQIAALANESPQASLLFQASSKLLAPGHFKANYFESIIDLF